MASVSAAALATVGLEAVAVMPASAASCTTYHGNPSYKIGYGVNPSHSDPNNIEGNFASLTIAQATMCTGVPSGNFYGALSSAWVMVASGPIGTLGFDQIGHAKWPGGSWYPFSQYNAVGGTTHPTMMDTTHALALNSTHDFEVAFVSGGACFGLNACFQNYLDGILYSQTDFDPLTNFGYPYLPEDSGEAYYPETGVAGSSTAPEHFKMQQVQYWTDNTWGATFPTGGFGMSPAGPGWSKTTWNTCSGFRCFDLWTQ